MSAIGGSLSYRAATAVVSWLAVVGRDSVVGRALVASAVALARAGSHSAVFATGRAGSRPLRLSGHPWSVLALSRPYLWLRDHLYPVSVSRPESCFAHGRWLSVVGAGLLALGVGRLALLLNGGGTAESVSNRSLSPEGPQVVAAAFLLAIGALILAAGPRLLRATGSSAVLRGGRWLGRNVVEGGSRAESSRATASGVGGLAPPGARPVVLGGVALALAAGLLLGLTPGADALVTVSLLGGLAVLALVLWRPEVMLLAVAAFPWIDWVARSSLGGLGPVWDDAFLLLCVILVVWAAVVVRRAELWTAPILLPALLAFVAAIGSVVVGDVPGDVAVFALRVLFQPLLFFFVGFLLPKTKRWVQWTVALFLLSSVLMAMHGLFQYITKAPMPRSWVDVRETDIATRAFSVIENPNGLGAFLLIGALISLSLALAPRLCRVQRWAMAAACVVQVAGVAVTFSRGAWLGLAAGVVALFVLAYRRYLAPLAAAGVLVWFVAPAQFTNRLSFAFSSTYLAKSLAAGRLYVWKLSLEQIVAHPLFGVGLGTFGGTAAVRFGYGRLWVDNFYLQLAAEGGLLLFVLFMWLLLRAAKGLVRAHGQSDDAYLRALAAGMFGAFIAVAAANATASVWETLVVGVAFWFFTGLVTSAVLHAEAPAEAPQESISKPAPFPGEASMGGKP